MKMPIKTILFLICCLVLQSATLLVAADDPNEKAVTDNRDFRDSMVSYRAQGIYVDVIFYDTPHQSGFWFYASTDSADYAVLCAGSSVSVHDNTSGSPGPALHTAKAFIQGRKYTFRIPISALGLSAGSRQMVRYWFFRLAGGGSAADRMPDSGTLRLKIH